MMMKKKVPSLVDLCIRTAIDNVRYLGDVGETDIDLLGEILPHCTVDQLMRIEKSTEGRDLSPVTDKLWKKFYEKEFGTNNASLVIERMKKNNVDFRWMQLYEAKLKDREEAEEKSRGRIRQLYQNQNAAKQSRQIQICNKVPPNPKRGFWSSFGGDSSITNTKSNLMKKAKKDFLKCQEVKNLTAMKRNAVQRHPSISPVTGRPGGSSQGSSSASKQIKPPQKRFF